MRSELVFGAIRSVSNRSLVMRLASKATRKFHRPKTRLQDTANDVFERLTHVNPSTRVSYTGNLQSFPCAARETHLSYDDLKQSMA